MIYLQFKFSVLITKSIYLRNNYGGLAHLARALAWQARGGRFESDILHE